MHYAGTGDQMLLNPSATDDGYEATFSIALDLSDTAVGPAGPSVRRSSVSRPGRHVLRRWSLRQRAA